MATRDFGGAVIPWYEPVIVGSVNFVHEKMPANPPADEVQKYLANQAYVRSKRSEGNSGFGGFVDRYVNPILDTMAADPLKTAAIFAATATGNAYLVPYIVGADTALAGGSPEDVLKSAAIAYVSQAAGGEVSKAIGADGFTGATETGLPTLAGESVGADLAGTTLLGDAGSTGAYESAIDSFPTPIDQTVVTPDVLTADDLYTGQAMTDLTTPSDTTKLAELVRTFENPTELTPTLDPNLIDVAPDNVTIATPEPTPTYDFSPETPIEQVSPELDTTGSLVTPEKAPIYDFSPDTPVQNVSPELDTTGTLADSLNPTLKDLAKTLRTANTIKNVVKALTPQEQAIKDLQTNQQKTNLANMLRGTQMPQTALPAIYKQKNPFNFGQQNQPVQDTTALANLLRTA
jgi:hypothetical protein